MIAILVEAGYTYSSRAKIAKMQDLKKLAKTRNVSYRADTDREDLIDSILSSAAGTECASQGGDPQDAGEEVDLGEEQRADECLEQLEAAVRDEPGVAAAVRDSA